ncbi:conjugal transfer protein TraF [Marinimicrobium locisalis]|uniref:conjugal transfer protein TraF n=1 Tax=Marinimicrobium locisalis TaxID=546022 RepID=UPI003221E400
MAGTGVVTARAHNASLFNPALLINHDARRHSRLHAHTYVGARLLDRDNFLQSAEDFSARYDDAALDSLIDVELNWGGDESELAEELRQTALRVREVQGDINHLSNKPLRASASYGVSFGYPTGRWAIGGYHRQFLVLGSVVHVSERDNANIRRVTDTVDRVADLYDAAAALRDLEGAAVDLESFTLEEVFGQARPFWLAALALDEYVDFKALYDDARTDQIEDLNVEDYLREPIPDEFFSTIETQGADVAEEAISVARSFGVAEDDRIHVGLSFKEVTFTTIHFEQRVDEFDFSAYNQELYQVRSTRFNMDLGMVHDLSGRWQWGVVVRNLLDQNYDTVRGDRIKQRPIARIGLGYRTEPLRISIDMDLTRNEPLGFDPDKQFVAVGAEWFLWRNTALRAGLRHNLIDATTLPSIGLGFGGRTAHLDIGVARSAGEDEWGVALQAGLAF